MAANKVIYGGETLVDLTTDTVTPDKLASGVTAHDKSGNKITGTMSARSKTYEITLATASGWVLLTTLDAEVLAHINDASLVVMLTNMSGYAYEWYSTAFASALNTNYAIMNGYPIYGTWGRQQSEAVHSIYPMYYAANNIIMNNSIGGALFRVDGAKYYFMPSDGFIRAGTYRLTFTW